MPRVDLKELAFGLFLIALALVAFGATGSLNVGTAADMGPGFVPRALAWVILGFGATFVVTSLLKASRAHSGAGVAAAGRDPGIDRAVCGAVLHARPDRGLRRGGAGRRRGHAPVRWRQLAACGVVIAAFSALLFVKGLGLPFKLWPSSCQLSLAWPW